MPFAATLPAPYKASSLLVVSGFFATRKHNARLRAAEQAFDALAADDLAAFTQALGKGALSGAWNTRGLTLFHQAAQSGRSAFLDALKRTEPKLDLDTPLPDGRTALQVAMLATNTANAVWLLGAGVDPNRAGPAGQRPLHLAAKLGSTTLLRMLDSLGAHWDVPDALGARPLDVLRQYHPNRARIWTPVAADHP